MFTSLPVKLLNIKAGFDFSSISSTVAFKLEKIAIAFVVASNDVCNSFENCIADLPILSNVLFDLSIVKLILFNALSKEYIVVIPPCNSVTVLLIIAPTENHAVNLPNARFNSAPNPPTLFLASLQFALI